MNHPRRGVLHALTRFPAVILWMFLLWPVEALTPWRTCEAGAPEKSASPADQGRVKRGEYLVTILGCHDCHTPLKMGPKGPEPDLSRMLSGHPEALKMPPPPKLEAPWMWAGSATNTAFAGPWGITYAPNLTPDENTGLGIWTEEMFVKAMKTGRHMGQSRPIMPPMPWQGYSHMPEEDLRAVRAYLRSVPPVRNQVPDYAPPGDGK